MPTVTERPPDGAWTIDSLREAGFSDLAGYELLDGRLVQKMGKTFPHWYVTSRFFLALAAVFESEETIVVSEGPVRLEGDHEPEPDVSVMSTTVIRERRAPEPGEIRLLVEIAVTSHAEDFGIRLQRAAMAEVPEYWVVDLVAPALHVYTRPDAPNAGYLDHAVIRIDDEVPYAARPLRTLLPPSFE